MKANTRTAVLAAACALFAAVRLGAEELEVETRDLPQGATTARLEVRATTVDGPLEAFVVSVAFDPARIRVDDIAPAGSWLAASSPELVVKSGTRTHASEPGRAALLVLLDVDGSVPRPVVPRAPGGAAQVIAVIDLELVPGGDGGAQLPAEVRLEDGVTRFATGPPLSNSLVIGGRDHFASSAAAPLILRGGGLTAPGGARFRRADSDGNGAIELTDAIRTLGYLFLGAIAPVCEDAADANDSGALDLSDAVYTLGYLFLGSDAPPAPGPAACGEDPTEDALGSCEAYPAGSCGG